MASFFDLGHSLIIEILLYLPPRDRLQNISKICKKLHQICSVQRSWRGQFFPLAPLRTLNNVSHPTHNHSASLYIPNHNNTIENDQIVPTSKGQMIIFGGNLSHNNVIEKLQNELWTFDFSSNTWSCVCNQDIPARTEHSSVVYENSLYVFGGFGGYYRNDLLSVRLPLTSESKFTEMSVTGDIPTPRSAHSMVVYNDHIYIFGGWRGIHSIQSNAELFKFNLKTKVWTSIPPKGTEPFRSRVHNCIVYFWRV